MNRTFTNKKLVASFLISILVHLTMAVCIETKETKEAKPFNNLLSISITKQEEHNLAPTTHTDADSDTDADTNTDTDTVTETVVVADSHNNSQQIATKDLPLASNISEKENRYFSEIQLDPAPKMEELLHIKVGSAPSIDNNFIVQLWLDQFGKIVRYEIKTNFYNKEDTEIIIRALLKQKFHPGFYDGVPVPATIEGTLIITDENILCGFECT